MELLLLEDINGIGKKNDIIVVGDGFALNHLLPQRKALVATPTVRKRYAEVIKRRAEEREKERTLQLEAASMLAGKSLTFTRKVTKTGKLFAQISEENISEGLRDQHAIDVPASAIDISEPIKATGTFSVNIKIGGASHTLPITVLKEEEVKKAAAKKK